MTRIDWNLAGERLFEAGVDRGVLYVGNDGVPWNGLISVSESSTGGDAQPFYLDGIKYANRAASEEFVATIEAYTYPDEFAQCDGTVQIRNGLFARNQRRVPFNLCYRTRVGNDIDGTDHGYKLHVIYNALAAPSEQAYQTIADKLDPLSFSWQITTKPASPLGYKPTPHLVIDSRETPAGLLAQIEDVLYGNSAKDPRLPSVGELTFLFEVYNANLVDGGYAINPTYGTIDAGIITSNPTITYDGGTP